jgi:hypothetical protein
MGGRGAGEVSPSSPLLFHVLPSGGADLPPQIQIVDLGSATYRQIALLPSAATREDAERQRARDANARGGRRGGLGGGGDTGGEGALPHDAMEVVHALPMPAAEGVVTVHR